MDGNSGKLKPHRILMIVNVDWFFLSHRLAVAQAALEAGYEVHIATAVTTRAAEIEACGFKLHPLQLDRKSTGLLNTLRLFQQIRGILSLVKPEILHLVTIKPVLLGALAARNLSDCGVIAAISGLGYIFTNSGLLARIRRLGVSFIYRLGIARSGVCVIVQNMDDWKLLKAHTGVKDDQRLLIPGSGVDLNAWPRQEPPAGAPVILMASRMLLDKGVVEFVDAARMTQKHGSPRFVLVGDVDSGNPSSISRAQLEAWVEEGVIEWWGPSDDMPAIMAAASLVVLPSYREGLPRVLIEAAATGRAIVTTDVPGCRDAIIENETGLLVPARDAKALAQAIQKLIDDPETRNEMGMAGRRLAESRFDIRQVVEQHLNLYKQCLDGQLLATQ